MEKYFHIQLTEDSVWQRVVATSLLHAMSIVQGFVSDDLDDKPYCWFSCYYENYN